MSIMQIKNRFTAAVIFECEISAEFENYSFAFRMGLAVKKLIEVSRANLTRADLTRADLTDANLTDADLTRADLTTIRDDLWAVLSATPREVDGLRKALIDGRVDGSTYQGRCACLIGTIANVRGTAYDEIDGLKPNSSRAIERFFMAIRKNDTPENSQAARLAVEWIDQWLLNMRGAFGNQAAAD